MVALTGIGLSAAAGLNASVPFLVIALLARFTDLVQLPAGFAWMTDWWAIGLGGALLLVDVVLDKVPVVDSINDAVQTVLRPACGGLVFAVTQAASNLDVSGWTARHTWVGMLTGVLVALIVHTGKATVRPAINAGTMGFGGPLVSTVEDVVSITLSLVAILVPVLVVLLLAGMAWALALGLRHRSVHRQTDDGRARRAAGRARHP